MLVPVNPSDTARPGSRFNHGMAHSGGMRRLVISGQVGMRPDGSVPEDFEAQMEQAMDNLFAVLKAARMSVRDLVKMTVFVTRPDVLEAYREIRDRKLAGHAIAMTYLQVVGLAKPVYLVEIEGEAVAQG